MRLYLINPSNPLVAITKTKEERWNRYRVWKPLSLMVLAGLTPPEWEIVIVDENLAVPNPSSQGGDRRRNGRFSHGTPGPAHVPGLKQDPDPVGPRIGVVFGNPEATTGGIALKFYSFVRLDIRRISTIMEGQEAVGNRTRVRIVKNRLAPPFKEVEFDIIYGEGISRSGELLDIGVKEGIIDRSGSWCSFAGERIGQGRKNTTDFFGTNPGTRGAISTGLEDALGLNRRESESVS